MTISVFDLFSIGIGPSSSHTVGPMRAAGRFVAELDGAGQVEVTETVEVQLYGSLAATGIGHGTLAAVLLGLERAEPETVTAEEVQDRIAAISRTGLTRLAGSRDVPLTADDIVLHPRTILPAHPNGIALTARDRDGVTLCERTYFSVGGGFVVTAEEIEAGEATTGPTPGTFGTASELLALAEGPDRTISEVMWDIETRSRSAAEVRGWLLRIRDEMWDCIARGVARDGHLPGPLGVRRRARAPCPRRSRCGSGTCSPTRPG